mmetsp:Transcript_7992/g.18398  ORF Transcript_7992/g.18398 Transcript_7992/m.18398 type:complete len:495 (-) Transcript_7992:23-1507(-)|eukprot:CAMPEP_0197895004 /NCGR_PEP_ID=MMETSP1439-20131203/36167_1 /TAXON_ID=66791 /ORGANISM="Gonyaulax spinifera, Strain CCMP409" /LENGTH=494 /DNA_ID=CAMNT_0043515399 /DNA_START=76 /DNA_END=1560 /DNA_ORIENTATION=+
MAPYHCAVSRLAAPIAPRLGCGAAALLTLVGFVMSTFFVDPTNFTELAQGQHALKDTEEAFEDTVAFLQGSVTLKANRMAIPTQATEQRRLTVPLRKQYVPITKNDSVIAYKTSYFGSIQVGRKERQSFTVVFDTGSGHLILPSIGCTSETCMNHRRYDRTVSEGAVDIDHTGTAVHSSDAQRDQLAISFGTGEVLGEFVRDSICLGPRNEDCVEANMVIAKKMTEEPFGLFQFDGVLGLGFGSLALNPHFSIFSQMVDGLSEMKPVFSVILARTDEGQSAISFGGHDTSWATSEIQWSPVAMQELGYWQVQLKSIRIGGTVLDDCADGTCRAILDTGTSLLGVPRLASRSMQKMLARSVPHGMGSDRAAVDCREVPGVDVHFELGNGLVIKLTPEDYSRPKPLNMTTHHTEEGWDLFCRALLLPVDMKEPLGPKVFIWGEPVLRQYLTIYDWAEKRVGFATAGTIPGGDHNSAIGAPPPDSLVAGAPLRSRVA